MSNAIILPSGQASRRTLVGMFAYNLGKECERRNLLPMDLTRSKYTPEMAAAVYAAMQTTPGASVELAAACLGVNNRTLSSRLRRANILAA